MERRRLIFKGHVQGVGFRVSANSLAQEFPVTGFIRNQDDGSVAMEVQGDPPQIDHFLLDLRERMGGYVKEELTEKIPAVESESGFEIRH